MSRILALADAEDAAPRASQAAREQLDAARAEARHAAPSDLVLVRVQLPAIAPEALVERFPEQDAVLWLPLILVTTLLPLRAMKSLLIALQFHHKAAPGRLIDREPK